MILAAWAVATFGVAVGGGVAVAQGVIGALALDAALNRRDRASWDRIDEEMPPWRP